MTTRVLALAAILVASAAWMVLLPAGAAAKVERFPGGGTEPNGRFTVTPDRVEVDVVPGQTTRIHMSLLNRTDRTVDVTLEVTDIEPTSDDAFVTAVKETQFGASSWVVPEIDHLKIESLETVEFDLLVTPPLDAPVGTNFAGVITKVATSLNDDSASKMGFFISALSQLYLTVPGEIQRDTRILKAVVADSFIFHGSGFVTYELTFANQGNVNDHVSGEIVVRSMFGNTVTTLDLKPYFILRGSQRTIRKIWPSPPRFGRFTAEARIETDDRQLRRKFPAVLVSPEWWWYLIIGVALLFPVLLAIRQRRNSWRQYLDEDFDEDFSDDDQWHSELT